MFDLQSQDGSVRRTPAHDHLPEAPAPKERATHRINPLDSETNVRHHQRLLDMYAREIDRQNENRREMARDEDFYDNEQWRNEDKAILESRGQVPLVYNVVATTVDWILGSERRMRSDFKVLPRRKQDAKPAERKSSLLKYLSDVNGTPFHGSRSFGDAVKVGIGWIEDGIQEGDEEPIYTRYESWRNILWDSSATETDLSDARYIFRTKWADVDAAAAMFSARRHLIEHSIDHLDEFAALSLFGDGAMDSQELYLDSQSMTRRSNEGAGGFSRRRVRLIEAWFRIPAETDYMVGGQFAGEIFDPRSTGHRRDVESGEAHVRSRTAMRMHVAIFTTSGLLYLGKSPYRHNRFPFTPVWGYRRGRNGMPYGVIRRIRDIQEDINKRASKALHILSTNKVIMDEGAVDDVDEFREEVARPDAIIIKKANKQLVLNAERDMTQWHLEFMSRSIAMVQQTSGVTDELMGRRTNADSGIAIQSRQDQGMATTSGLFDNYRFAKLKSGEKQCSLLEQYMTEKKAFRITNMRGNPEYIEVNDGLPENDIAASKADFIISEADWKATIRQAQADELFSLMGKIAPVAPQIVLTLLDLLVESMDLPNRDEIVKRIRQVTGARDPDQDEPTPEEMAKQQANAQQQQLQMQIVMGQLRKLMAEASKAEAQAADIAAKTAGTNVSTQKSAIEAAIAALTTPSEASHVADHILSESGYVSKSEMERSQMERTQEASANAAAASPPPEPSAPPSAPGMAPADPAP